MLKDCDVHVSEHESNVLGEREIQYDVPICGILLLAVCSMT